jgi:cytochrome c
MRLFAYALLIVLMSATDPARSADAAPAGDPTRGATVYERCGACHSLERDRTGPRHCDLIGRKAGSVSGFGYSRAMRQAGIVWSRATLDSFLESPRKAVPGTIMGYAGVKDPADRRDLIAYLEQAGADPALCPKS